MSLTLAQMATFITNKVGQFDSTSIALCKTFLDRRYRMIWDSFFWRDTELLGSASLTAGNATFAYPGGMERVVSIRAGGDHFLDPVNQDFLIQSDPTIFERSGTPIYYDENTTSAGVNQIIVYPTPAVNTNFLILGKRLCAGLSADADISILRNCDNAIIAFAMGDMLERARQYGKSQSKFQEAASLLEEAKNVESAQANQPRAAKN